MRSHEFIRRILVATAMRQTMNRTVIPACFEFSDMPISAACGLVLVVPMKARDGLQTIYILDLQNRKRILARVNLKDHAQTFYERTESLKRQLGIDDSLYPFGLSRQMYRDFCITPHSFLYLGSDRILCGLELFTRYEILDLDRHAVELLDPDVDDDWLTASPSFDPDGNLRIGSTALSETIKGIKESDRQSFTRFWRIGRDGTVTQAWQGRSGALLHQMKVAGAPHGTPSAVSQEPTVVYVSKDGSVSPGRISGGAYVNFTNMQSGTSYKVGPFDVPAHVEVHPSNPNIVYLSEHNFRISSGQPVILGNASVYKYELGEAGPAFRGRFTHPDLYRMTSHELFNRKGEVYMALTGYPDTIFIVHADTLELVQRIRFRDGERVDLSKGSHLCAEPTYGCQISPDGSYLYVIESAVLNAFDLDNCSLRDEFHFGQEEDTEFTGHSYGFARHPGAVEHCALERQELDSGERLS
jgi:hypothetical protein